MTFQQWLDCFNPSIICLQGTHSTSEHEIKQSFKDTSYSIASSPGSINSVGVAILFKNTIKCEQSWRNKAGRFIISDLNLGNYTIRIVNVYGPNKQKDGIHYFESLYQALDPNTPTFFCGDFNVVPSDTLDRLDAVLHRPIRIIGPLL